jgi:hypothetical protein
MTVVATKQVAAYSVYVPSLRTRALILGRSLSGLLIACSRGFVDASRAYARALEPVYVRPGGVSVEKQRRVLETDGEGRDPSW